MKNTPFTILCYSTDSQLAIAATRSGGTGVLSAEYGTANLLPKLAEMEHPTRGAKGAYGVHFGKVEPSFIEQLEPYLNGNLHTVIVNSADAETAIKAIREIKADVRILVEMTKCEISDYIRDYADGIVIKGNESGGYVGEESAFILLQTFAKATDLPLIVRGGITPHVAAAVTAMGAKGVVLDSQLLLLNESPVQQDLQKLLAPLSGSETVAVGDGEGEQYFRVLNRPQLKAAKEFIEKGETLSGKALTALVSEYAIDFQNPTTGLLPVGHDVCFAEAYRKQYGSVTKLVKAIRHAVATYAVTVADNPTLAEGNPLAETLGTRYPIVQGPMTRVSDTAAFANSIAEGGALPMLAFALMRPAAITKLLEEAKATMGEKPWGIGLLGFVPPQMLKEQIAAALPFKPNYAIIAGGRPDQAVEMEKQGIPSYLHLPSANLLENFLKGGARRFIFEGRECGGHIGPLSSFTLWSTMIDRMLTVLDEQNIPGSELECLFAGGIHDAYSSALLQVMLAPLAQKGVKLGVIMGSAYLFTKEIVEGKGIVQTFQDTVIECEHTVNLESGPGHASRAAYTPFAKDFFEKRREYKADSNLPADEVREKLDDLILGTLRTASKGVERQGDEILDVSDAEQKEKGMYMLGQVVTLRDQATTIEELHQEVTQGASNLLAEKATEKQETIYDESAAKPVDIAIVGIECALPGAKNTREYWQNILDKIDAVTEVPTERWDTRLYFDEDRHAKDKVYSKWGGFMDDMVFDPMKYGITPKSIESVDPMQLMTLEVAKGAMDDAGFDFDSEEARSRTAVIIGASGGAGDVGMQYGLRSELPRFFGELPESLDESLPKWSEDTFAGILINVTSGRISNRLNLGGVNYTTDAACASSLSAVYQGVNELTSGNCDVVVTGGTDTVQGAFGYMCFSQTQALSPTGRCRTFDESSDGIVISEGIVMLVMKRLEDAEADGDRIYSVIKGVGGGSDGKAKGLSAPLPAGQLRAMRRAYQQAGFSPDTIGLFEAHGTGTIAGDTAELESTSSLVREAGCKPRNAVIGSVKTMIGHTKATAGVAGLAKASLALYHKTLPPHAGVKKPNAVFLDETLPLHFIDEARPWVAEDETPRRAAVSAFGFGGTNFHAVLEEYEGEYRTSKQQAVRDNWDAEIFLFNGENKDGLMAALQKMQAIVAQNPDVYVRDIAKAQAKTFTGTGEVMAIVAETTEQLQTALENAIAHLSNGEGLEKTTYYSAHQPQGKLAVLFSGQGSQYTGMLQDVAVHFPAMRDALSDADASLKDAFEKRFDGKNLSHFIMPRAAYDADAKKAAEKALTSTDIAQPALGAVEAGLWALMQEYGLSAELFAGHSYGEFVALFAAGQISFEDLMKISEARGRLIVDKAAEAGSELGTMAAIRADRKDIEPIIKSIKDVVVANHNSPKQVILSGSTEGIKSACEKCAEAGMKSVKLPVSAAFHSPFVEPARKPLEDVIKQIDWRKSDAAVYSNNTSKPHDNAQKAMADHLTGPVEFVSQITNMYEDGARVFLELGPKNVLTKLTGQILSNQPHTAIAFDDHGGGVKGMLHAFAALIAAGVELDATKLFNGRDCLDVSLDKLAIARRTPDMPKHAWLLNGSVARKAHEAVKQVGTTIETRDEHKKAAPVAAPTQTTLPQASHTPVARRNQPTKKSTYQPRQRKTMQPKTNHESVTQAYFDLVSQQLDNARDVALAELGIDIATTNVAAPAPARQAPAPRSQAASRNVAALPGRSAAPAPAPRPVAVAPTPAPAAPQKAAEPAAVKTAPAAPASVNIKDVMLNVVTEKTGYEADMIAFDQNLEADLGVDSIKRVDIVGGVLDALPAATKDAIGEAERGKLNTAKTLDEMLAVINAVGGASKAPAITTAPAASNVVNIKDVMLNVVTEKTGYEADMIAFDQNLEADLGVDSIKRVDIVGGVLDALPNGAKDAIGEDQRGKLNTAKTLDEMLGIIEAVAVNFSSAGVSENVEQRVEETANTTSPRLDEARAKIVAEAQSIPATAARGLTSGTFVITEDALGVAKKLEKLIDAETLLIPTSAQKDEDALLNWCEKQTIDNFAGIIHLASLGLKPLDFTSSVNEWKEAMFASEKVLFLLTKHFSSALKEDGHVLSASSLGGLFGREKSALGLNLQAGSPGMIKSLCKEREWLRGKSIDLDPAQKPAALAEQIFTELSLKGGRHEVGYPKGARTIFRTEYTGMPDLSEAITETGLVTLATGGARGVTAEVLRELAQPGNTLILTGRSPLPGNEALLRDTAELAALTDEKSLTRHFVKSESLPLGDARKKAGKALAAREMMDNIADFEANGATVEYYAVDVADEAAMQTMFDSLYETYSKIDGIVHGAGIIEDKFLADIPSDSWNRVVHTKVIGMLLLQKYVKAEQLKFFTVFSSVAGRYGNSGQSNYATGNELMNRVCSQLQSKWEHVKVAAFNWGPWGKTKFGAGMVTEATEAKFAKHGVYLVTAELGRFLFRYQVEDSNVTDEPEIICGEAPWEDSEQRRGEFILEGGDETILGTPEVNVLPKGDVAIDIKVNPNHPYLQDHIIDTEPVLPMAMAIEMMAQAALEGFGKNWKVLEIRDAQLFKGVFVNKADYPLTVKMVMQSHGLEGEAIVKAKIVASEGKALPHYGATIVLGAALPEAEEEVPSIEWKDQKPMSVNEAYDKWLFHGPSFQVITDIEEYSEQGAKTALRTTSQADLLGNATSESWLFDPAVIDAAAHMSVLWMAHLRDLFALPVKFGRIVRYAETLPKNLTMHYVVLEENSEHIIVDVFFTDEQNKIVLKIEQMQHVASKGHKVGNTNKKKLAA